nr:signal peptidase I [Eggerthella lenta]
MTFVYVGHAYAVPTGSMEKTIMTGDRVLAEKVSYYLRDPEPGDIVMFEDPDIPGRLLLKRCIAVGGQTVDINDEDGLVYVDGVALREPYTAACPRTRLPATSPTPTRCPKA